MANFEKNTTDDLESRPKISNEDRQAISFAEYYFALADGVFPGFENHLAKDVVLEWFGKKIQGKNKVTAFVCRSSEINTLHTFTQIESIKDIIYKTEQKNQQQGDRQDHENTTKHICDLENSYDVVEESGINDQINDHKEKSNLNVSGHSNIKSFNVSVEEMYRMIELKEEMASSSKFIKRKYENQEDAQANDSVAEAGTMKYVKADGKIKFTRTVIPEDPWAYHWASEKMICWVRKCRLQIAYSRIKNDPPEIPSTLINKRRNRLKPTKKKCNASMQPQYKQSRLEEIIAISNNLIPDVNNFGGYLKPLNYIKDRNDFLEDFENSLAQKNLNVCLPTACYMGNKLIFKFKNDPIRKLSNGNYQIHRIIYENINAHVAKIAIE